MVNPTHENTPDKEFTVHEGEEPFIVFAGPDGLPWRTRPVTVAPESVPPGVDASLWIVEDASGVFQGVLTLTEQDLDPSRESPAEAIGIAFRDSYRHPGAGSTPLEEAALFPLGALQITQGAVQALFQERLMPEVLLARHARGDWGDLDAHDRRVNREALRNGQRLLSTYTLPKTGAQVWIITDAGRQTTTLLIPSEY